ncbi:hypothetical protein CONPUDRAFT_50878 [Coniophora puteana RWD-64-598 SS2]|uniref:Pre-mRNA-splicing factor CWC26 n=1 Tax=Coniophora puteana (strain RWD-64-598) TaxID=741705 RepID=A0A5M3MZX5_CONPW|nr:uncharacterized protein CONPUDRAFT_50878 [Coniophora puteana RWD-64-598 SS2]EIW84364.1 hypothetical protein CONPUDRAFT_50878 [Coniophora puteana RWD-64-598 SS2]
MSSMKTYLAEKYMSGPKADAILARTAPKKKKKRKVEDPSASANGSGASRSAMLVDDDAGWGTADAQREEVDDLEEATIAKDRSFKKRRTAADADGKAGDSLGWQTVREGEMPPPKEETPPPPEDEKPQVVEQEQEQPFRGGLLTADKLRKALPKAKAPSPPPEGMTQEEQEAMQETVYRDASGRKIDAKAAKAEAARKKREREEKDAEKMEWGKGVVQREEKDKARRQMEKNRTGPFARTVEDKDMNEEMKAQDRWADPAAAFLTVRRSPRLCLHPWFNLSLLIGLGLQKKSSKGPRKPQYTGPPPPPNRFGIKPGYRWDGVDRSNGFEKKLFQHQNEQRRKTAASYEWSVDDM